MPTATTSKPKAPPKAPKPPKPPTPAQQAAAQRRQAAQQKRQQAERKARRQRVLRAPGGAAAAVTQRKGRYTARHMLTAELIVGVLIVAVRAVADYEPQADGTLKGKVGHPKGQYGPLPILAGLIVVFFLLSFLASGSGLKAKLAVIGGGIVDLALLMNSSAEFQKVTGTFGTFGKAKVPPGAWITSGTASGLPISGGISGSGGGGSPIGTGPSSGQIPTGAIPLPPDGNCPAGYFRAAIQTKHGIKVFCQPGGLPN